MTVVADAVPPGPPGASTRVLPGAAASTPEPSEDHARTVRNRQLVGFGVLVLVCVAAGVGYLLYARDRSDAQEKDAKRVAVASRSDLDTFVAEPHTLFRSTAYGDTYGKVAVVPNDDPKGPRALTPLSCERVDMAADHGVCLVANRGVLTTYGGLVFDKHFRVQHRFDLPGLPSRARVAPDGSVAAMTVFVSGDSYAENSFSTRTMFVDLDTGELLGNLEEFRVTNDGSVVDAVDRNFWGVTFAPDSDTFYATLQTGGQIYLIKGKLSDRTAKVVDKGIECPALSPDGTRIAYKKRIGNDAAGAVAPPCARPRDRQGRRALRDPQRRRPGGVVRRVERAVRAAAVAGGHRGDEHVDRRRRRVGQAAAAGAAGLVTLGGPSELTALLPPDSRPWYLSRAPDRRRRDHAGRRAWTRHRAAVP